MISIFKKHIKSYGEGFLRDKTAAIDLLKAVKDSVTKATTDLLSKIDTAVARDTML